MFTVLTNKNYQKFQTLDKKPKFKYLKDIKESKVNLMNNPEGHLLHLALSN